MPKILQILTLVKVSARESLYAYISYLGTIQLLRLHKLGGFLTPPPPLFAF